MSNYFALKASAVAGSGGYFKTGTIIPWTTATQADLPGFLICNGTAVSRSTYAALFAVIAETYGAGDGVSTFNLPNFQQKVLVGQDGNTNYTIGDSGGNTTPNIAFPSATIDMSVTDPVYGTNSRTENANAPLPAHTHLMFANVQAPNSDNPASANQQATYWRGGPGDGPTDFKYSIAGTSSSAARGLTGNAGSGNGAHRHNLSKTSSGAASFNQQNLNANANTVIAPYQTVTFMIKT